MNKEIPSYLMKNNILRKENKILVKLIYQEINMSN